MVENGYRHLAERTDQPSASERRQILVGAAQQVGPALFYSLIIIVVSFLPVFLLEAQEGRMFRPLAWTKTLALVFSSLLSITLVPALMPLCLRGKLRPESQNPAARISQAMYLPVLRWCLRHRKLVIALNLIFLASTIPLYFRLGSQFMPALYEGSSLYMPSALPGISITRPFHSCRNRTASFVRSLRCPQSSAPLAALTAPQTTPPSICTTHHHAQAPRAMAPRNDL